MPTAPDGEEFDNWFTSPLSKNTLAMCMLVRKCTGEGSKRRPVFQMMLQASEPPTFALFLHLRPVGT